MCPGHLCTTCFSPFRVNVLRCSRSFLALTLLGLVDVVAGLVQKLASLEVRVPDEAGEGEDDGARAPGRLRHAAVLQAAAADEVVDGAQRDRLYCLHHDLTQRTVDEINFISAFGAREMVHMSAGQ